MIALRAERLFDGETMWHDRAVLIEAARIAALPAPEALPPDVPVVTLEAGSLLAPGFVDVQVNGGGGVMFNDAIDAAGLRRIAAAHARIGTTTILPTLISGTPSQLRQALAATRAALESGLPGIAGLHLEGPFIALARRGIHPAASITTPDDADLALLCTAFPGKILLTLAPEIVSAEHIAAFVRAGITVFAGHSDAGFEQVQAGLDAGITGFTHLFNAMSQLGSRSPGMVGAALQHAGTYAGIIADLHHVHPASIRIAHAAKGPCRLFLVSDAMATAASAADGFMLNGEAITLAQGRLSNAGGTLAGAHLTLAEAVRNAVHHVGLELADALRMATATPAEAIGLPDRGRLAPGARADLVVLNGDLRVTDVWQGGTRLVRS